MSSSAYQALWMTIARGSALLLRPVEAADLHRKPVFAVVIIAGGVGAVRASRRSRSRSRSARRSPNGRGPSRGRGRRGGFRPCRSAGRRGGSAARSTAARNRRCRSCRAAQIWCWSSAALAVANSCGSMPAGRPERRLLRSGEAARADRARAAAAQISDGRTTRAGRQRRGSRRPPHGAPRRNISRRFNDIHTLPNRSEAFIIQWVNRPITHMFSVARSIAAELNGSSHELHDFATG